MPWLVVALAALIATVLVSYVVEALRRQPIPPSRLDWAPAVPIRSLEVEGLRLRYIVAGEGPPLVLLHTLRTQLDMFQKVLPALAARYRVYAIDYPAHGFSDIPTAEYTADFFVRTVGGALERLDIRDAVIAGESIGGSIALLLAARHEPRVRAVVAINPYDYAGGRGVRRSSALANLVFGLNDVPVLGATVSRLRMPPIVARIMRGGVVRKGAMPPALARELYRVGNRRGHYQALMSLIRHSATWEAARAEYRSIDRPTLLVYGDHDWSRPGERAANARDIPGAELHVIPDAGHFLSLDAPDELVAAILGWPPAGRTERASR
jgi:pimeloyl-ACP methyl ester carboxylesterase